MRTELPVVTDWMAARAMDRAARLEAGLGGGQRTVVEADGDDGGIEQAAVFEIGADQRIGQGEYLDRLGAGVEEARTCGSSIAPRLRLVW
jgi:hypothetical protein